MKTYKIIITLLLSILSISIQAQNSPVSIPTQNTKTNNHYIAVSPFNILRGEFKASYELQIPKTRHSFLVSASKIHNNLNRKHINFKQEATKGHIGEVQYRYQFNTPASKNKSFVGGYGRLTKISQDYTVINNDWNLLTVVGIPIISKTSTETEESRSYEAIDLGFVMGKQWTLGKNLKMELIAGAGRNVKTKEDYEEKSPNLDTWAASYRLGENITPRLNWSLGFAF